MFKSLKMKIDKNFSGVKNLFYNSVKFYGFDQSFDQVKLDGNVIDSKDIENKVIFYFYFNIFILFNFYKG